MAIKTLTVDRALTRAHALRKRGYVAAAQSIYQQILDHAPENQPAAEALKMLRTQDKKSAYDTIPAAEHRAVMAAYQAIMAAPKGSARNRKSEAAVTLAHKFNKQYPDNYFLHYVLGLIYFLKADYEKAAQSLETAIALNPQEAESHVQLGLSHIAQDNMEAAHAAFAGALELDPANTTALKQMAFCQLHFGQPEEAHALFEQLDDNEQDIDILCGRGQAYIDRFDYRSAQAEFEKALAADETHLAARIGLGRVLLKKQHLTDALREFRLARQAAPDNPEIRLLEAETLYTARRHDDALTACDAALTLKPNDATALTLKGDIYSMMGRQQAALDALERAVEADANFAPAWSARVHLIKFNKRIAAKHQKKLDAFFTEKSGLNPQITTRATTGLALAKIHNDMDETNDAFPYYLKANQLLKDYYRYDTGKSVQLFQHIKDIFAPITLCDVVDAPYEDSRKLIFILGLPRAGSSLVEQILAAHSTVFGGGELTYMKHETDTPTQLMPQSRDPKSATSMFQSIGRAYLGHLRGLDTTHPVMTDKTPHNFLRIGYILGAFPEAKIIHVTRNPMAVCWSNFQHQFPAGEADYCYNLEDIGHYHTLYLDLMAYWHDKFPDRIYNLDYEKLTQQQEVETRNVLDYCELDWQNAVLDFHKINRPVHTASRMQVKEKIYSGSSQAWRAYDKYLQPLKQAMEQNPYMLYADNS